MKVRLIQPRKNISERGGFWELKISGRLTDKRYGGIPLSLPTIAALTPNDFDVDIIDENIEPINFDDKVDLVGITVHTANATRAYEIAGEYKKKGVKVVLGGIHASALPQEAVLHADLVVIGEAENVWGQLLDDFKNNKLIKFYQSPQKPDLKYSPVPRWDLLKLHKYNFCTIQTTRGCPFNCEFCSVKTFFGEGYRHKPIENVIKEIKRLQEVDQNKNVLVFADDNIVASPSYAKKLFKTLIPLKIKYWWGQASIKGIDDSELLKLMYLSGCRQIFIGFESLSRDSLIFLNKDRINKVEYYKEIVNKIHSHGIAVFASIILGTDCDNTKIFRKTVDFINESNIPFAQVTILTPLPGTPLQKRLNQEGRILHYKWEKYDFNHVCFNPKLMSIDELKDGHAWVHQNIYSLKPLYKRLSNLWDKGILTEDKKSKKNAVSKERILFIIYLILTFYKRKISESIYLLKSLLYPKNSSILDILLGLHFYYYASTLVKNEKQKDKNRSKKQVL